MSLKTLNESVHLFFANTTLHGLKYSREKSIPLIGRLLWIAFFVLGLCFATFLSIDVLLKYNESPIITSLKSPNYDIVDSVNFPAVTLCNYNYKVHQNKTQIRAKKHDSPESSSCYDNVSLLLTILQSIWMPHHILNDQLFIELIDNVTINCNLTSEAILQMIPTVAPLSPMVTWNTHAKSASIKVMKNSHFYTLTNVGNCYSVNSDIRGPVKLGRNYKKSKNYSSTIKKIESTGYNTGIGIFQKHSGYELGRTYRVPSKYLGKQWDADRMAVLIHDPKDIADLYLDKPFYVTKGQTAEITFRVVKMAITANVEGVALEKRKCFVPGDEPVKLLDLNPSLVNCYSDCMARHLLEECGCLPFFYASLVQEGRNVSKCDLKKYPCLINASDILHRNLTSCNCYPNCDAVYYEADISYQHYDAFRFTDYRINGTESSRNPSVSTTYVYVYAKHSRGIEYESTLRYTTQDLIVMERNFNLKSHAIASTVNSRTCRCSRASFNCFSTFCCNRYLHFAGKFPEKGKFHLK